MIGRYQRLAYDDDGIESSLSSQRRVRVFEVKMKVTNIDLRHRSYHATR